MDTTSDVFHECNTCGVKLSQNDGCWAWNKEDDTYNCVSCEMKRNPDSSEEEEDEVLCERCDEPVYYEGNEGKIDKYGDIVCEECFAREQYEMRMFPYPDYEEEEEEDEEEEDEEECWGFCFVCEKPLYDILQKDGTENCSCKSPCTNPVAFNRRSK